MIEEQKRQFFAMKKGEQTIVKNFGGKVSLSRFPEEHRNKILKRLAEKDETMARGLTGELPGLLIDGKQVTKDNIHEFELKPKKIAVSKEIRKEIVEETYPKEVKEELYKKSDLEKLSMKELKVIGKEFGTTDRSKKNLIKEILKLQK